MDAHDSLDRYRSVLEDVATTCWQTLHLGGRADELPEIDLRIVEPGRECVRTDHSRVVLVAVSSDVQLAAPPVGMNVIYGVCHEVGHLAVARRCRPHPLPPVVWDEALAHLLAIDVFLPVLDPDDLHERWPGGYVGFPACELARADAADPDGYFRHLDHQIARLRRLHGGDEIGIGALLEAVATMAPRRVAVADWYRQFTRALQRARTERLDA